jgi:hypothetical protein
MPISPLSRRDFMKTGIAADMGAWSLSALAAEPVNGIPYRTLGRTGERVSLVGLGGFHIGMQKTEEESIRIIRTALDVGVNFLDNCWTMAVPARSAWGWRCATATATEPFS